MKNDKSESTARTVADIRREIQRQGGASADVLRRIEAELSASPGSPELWILRGDAIQLGDDTVPYSLADAESSYLRALELDPGSAEAAEELGYFYYAVMDDARKAEPFFVLAIELGAGPAAEEGLAEAREEIQELESPDFLAPS